MPVPFQSTLGYRATTNAGQDVKAMYYLGVYGAIGLAYLVTSLLREAIVFSGSLRASRKIHLELLNTVMRARFRFFDSTPLGRIINRFSKGWFGLVRLCPSYLVLM